MDNLHDKIEKIKTPEFNCMWGPEKAYERAVEDTTLVAEEYIADLQKKLDKQIGYKEDYRVSYTAAMDDLHQVEARFIEQRDSLVSATKKLVKTEARLAEEQRISTLRGNTIEFDLIPALSDAQARVSELEIALKPFAGYLDKAICTITMTWEDAGGYKSTYKNTLKTGDFFAARAALTPPADLVERAKGGE